MHHIFAPWRTEYVTGTIKVEPDACVFCEMQKPGDDRERLVLWRGRGVFVVMNRYPYNNGHLLVLPTAHHSHFRELQAETFLELHQTLARGAEILEQVMQCQAINLGMNLGRAAGAGIPGHMHYHLVPRWNGDTNFMPVIGETKVISQHLMTTYDLLAPRFK